MALLSLRRLLWLGLTAGWMGFIFYLSSQPAIGVAAVEGDSEGALARRQLAHAVAFGALAAMLRLGLGGWGGTARSYLAAFAVTIAYAAGDEAHQLLTPGRVGSARDVGIDGAGAVAALAGWRGLELLLARARRTQRSARPAPSGETE